MQLTEELHALVSKLELEEHHLADEARAIYEKLATRFAASSDGSPDADPKGAPSTPAEPPAAS